MSRAAIAGLVSALAVLRGALTGVIVALALGGAALAGVLIAMAIFGTARAQPAPPDGLARASVESGVVLGFIRGPAAIFRDVPYAAPPVGPLRWAPPKPPLAWPGERVAAAPGPSCPQPMNPDGSPNLGAANGRTSEDCLQLNVFAPKDAKGAPVMVWLHGGGYAAGAGWIYDGQSFARDGVVFVAINYRLGMLGFFAHPDLAKAAKPIGNYGLMDQIAALQWVKRNIAAFGGDPGNVTIAGESAGGSSVLTLLATPSTKGLFHKAIVQSAGVWNPPRDPRASEVAQMAALGRAGLGRPGLDALRALPADRLAAIPGDYGPMVEDALLPRPPTRAFAEGNAADVPLIIGWNSGEDSLLGPGATSDQRQAYTDGWGAYARWVAAKASGGQPAWLYHFSYVGSRFRPGMTTAAHAAEVQYMLEYWGRRTPASMVAADDRAMASLMHGCWVAFAKTGVPACGSEAWPAYDPATDQLMEFGNASGLRTHFRKPELDAAMARASAGK